MEPKGGRLDDLRGVIDVSRYLRPTSDIVALLVLEYQCRMHNLLTSASMQYRRASYLGRALDANADPDLGTAGRVADAMADRIVECLFFKDEVEPGEDLEGGLDFQKAFAAQIPKSSDGRSLGDFQLYHRIFKHRCSYMIYSEAFRGLPPRVKDAVMSRVRRVLDGDATGLVELKGPERERISEILKDTLKD